MSQILMSMHNPNGHKLEELLGQLILEIGEKNVRIVGDQSKVAQRVLANNLCIMEHLANARSLQIDSMNALDKIAPANVNKPRIGCDSEEHS